MGCVPSGSYPEIALTSRVISVLAFFYGEIDLCASCIPLVSHPNPFQNRYIPIVYKVWDLSYNGQYMATQLVVWNPEQIVRARLPLHDTLGTDLCLIDVQVRHRVISPTGCVLKKLCQLFGVHVHRKLLSCICDVGGSVVPRDEVSVGGISRTWAGE